MAKSSGTRGGSYAKKRRTTTTKGTNSSTTKGGTEEGTGEDDELKITAEMFLEIMLWFYDIELIIL